MDPVRWEARPQLHNPVMVAAFEGWNDAGDAATTAARFLASEWGATPFASIEPDEFYDFTVVRPHVRLVDGLTRRIDWPANTFSATSGPRDVVVFEGIEPNLRWKAFAGLLVDVARQLGVELVVTLGALLADVAHTRPVRVTGTAGSEELVRSLGLVRSRYEGPTGIVGVLHDALAQAGVPSASLWATVPAYVAKTPSPKGALALVERVSALLGAPVDTVSLQIASASYERQVSEVVAEDEDVASYVRALEASDDADPDSVLADQDADVDAVLGDPGAIAAEAERFLREQGDG